MIEYSPFIPVLFLDIDGVLNAHQPLDPAVMSSIIRADKVKILNAVLKVTGCQIVLSSAWRYMVHRGEMKLEGFSWLLRSHGVFNRLVGLTRSDTMLEKIVPRIDNPKELWTHFPQEKERGSQIAEWLRSHGHGDGHMVNYAVVDDGGKDEGGNWCDLGITAYVHPVVWTNPEKGITWEDAEQLVELLKVEKPDGDNNR